MTRGRDSGIGFGVITHTVVARTNAVNRGRKKTLVHLTTVRRRSSGQCERGTSERAAGERGKFCVGRARAAQSALVDRYLCHEVARKIARRMPGEPSAREHIRSAMRSRRRRRRQAQTAATQSRLRAKWQLIARQGWGSGRGASSGAPLPKHTSQTHSNKNTVGICRQGGVRGGEPAVAHLTRCKHLSTVGPPAIPCVYRASAFAPPAGCSAAPLGLGYIVWIVFPGFHPRWGFHPGL